MSITLKKNIVLVLSTSKLNLSSIIPFLIEYTDAIILVVSTSIDKYHEMRNVTFKSINSLNYDILCADSHDSLNSFISKLTSNRVRVGLIDKTYSLYNELIESNMLSYVFSACREHLLCYVQDFNSANTICDILIYCFDNDKSIAKKANGICNNNIKIIPCVAHSVCTSVTIDSANKSIILNAEKESTLSFPKEAKALKTDLIHYRKNQLSHRTILKFANSKEEFEFYKLAKLININMMHTAVCLLAYVVSSKKGYTLDDAANMPVSDIITEKDITFFSELHQELVELHLHTYNHVFKHDIEEHTNVMLDFLNHLINNKEETLIRGLYHKNSNFEHKFYNHIPMLLSSHNKIMEEIVGEYKRLINY